MLAIPLIDIDGMKKVNDSNKSHSAGSNAIRLLVKSIKKHSADETIIIRPEQAAYVIALMPNKSIEEANKVGINIQNDIKESGLDLEANLKYPLTVSIGTCNINKITYTPEDIIQMIHSSNMSIKEARKEKSQNSFKEFSGMELLIPEKNAREKIFPEKLMVNFETVDKIQKNNGNVGVENLDTKIALKEVMNTIASKDEITGLYRRSFVYNFPENNRLLNNLLSKTNTRKLSVAVIDVDGLGKMNLKYGPVGDKVMKLVSEMAMKHCGVNDIMYSHAGDEIIVLSPSNNKEIVTLCEKIRKDVMNIVLENDGTKPITVSAGTRTANIKTNNIKEFSSIIEKLIDDADKGLYKAKTSGKNKVQSFESLKEIKLGR